MLTDLADFVVRHGEVFVFLYVLVDQLGIPLPAVPALLAMGALAAVGKINFGIALVLSVVASLTADMVWYALGRARGSAVLRLLCRLSLEPDSCVRRTEDVFVRYGVRSIIIAKFVPGLSTVAPPLAGIVGVSVPRFIAYSTAAALLWTGTWGGLGYLAGDAVAQAVEHTGRFGTLMLGLVAAAVVTYVAVKWVQRRRFIRRLRVARVTPEALERALASAVPTFVVDLRSSLDVDVTPFVIPGALRIPAEELELHHGRIPRDRDVVVYCS